MKRLIVRLLYDIGLKKLAFRIDPFYAYVYADIKSVFALCKEVSK